MLTIALFRDILCDGMSDDPERPNEPEPEPAIGEIAEGESGPEPETLRAKFRAFSAAKGKPGRPKGRKGNGPAASPGSGAPSKLTGEDMSLIVRLTEAGQSAHAIAEVLSRGGKRPISARTVERWRARARTPNEVLAQSLASLRHEAIDGWATAIRTGSRYGKHAPSRDLLQATGVIERDTPADRITIHVGDGTIAIGRLPDVLVARVLPPASDTQD